MRRHLLWATAVILVLAALMFAACGPASQTSTFSRDGEGPPTLVAANTEFAVNFYHALRESEDGNLFFSPYSLSVALAMAHAGAAQETRQQMTRVLSFQSLPLEDLYESFGVIQESLANPANAHDVPINDLPRLEIGNAMWGHTGYNFMPEFVETISNSFRADVMQADFQGDPGGAARAVNKWASDSTDGKILQVIDPSNKDKIRSTRIMLANAVYLKGDWHHEFQEEDTDQRSFYLQNGGSVLVPTMIQTEYFNYGETEDYQAVELLYKGGDLSAVVLLPREGKFREFESALSGEVIRHIMDQQLREQEMNTKVNLYMPKFKMEAKIGARKLLQSMGMKDAFQDGKADFSGIIDPAELGASGDYPLYIEDVLQKTFVEVDETGTEAAAVTVVWGGASVEGLSKPPPVIVMDVNRPFIFIIQDRSTGTILFLGRIMDPR